MRTELAHEIAEMLTEKNTWQIRKVVNVIGAERARAFFQQTLAIEAEGGMLVTSGKRQRTPGGVFFYLVRKNVSAEERKAIFARTKKKKAGGRPQPPGEPPVKPPTWDEGQAYIRKLWERPKGQVSQLKFTLIDRPTQITKAKTCMVCVMAGKPVPQSMPKGLPLPPDIRINFAVFIAEKQWQQVADSLKADVEDELIVEGYPVFDPKQNVTVVLAQSVTTKRAQRAKWAARKAGA
jgi:hypothetical protein